MARPGTQIISREISPPRSAPTDTGIWFAVGLAEKGPSNQAEFCTSFAEVEDKYGARQSDSVLMDSLETFFREGGSRCYVARVVGPAPISAFKVLNDGAAAATLRVEAANSGAWGNSLNVEVVAGSVGGTFVLVVSDDALGELERSPDLADKTEALAWAEASDWIVLVDQASVNDPAVVAVQSLAGGTDDRASATETHWANALALFTRDLGPGQVSMPGRTTATALQNLFAHAAANNRVALGDLADTPTKATLTSAASAIRSLATARYGGFFAPWVTIPGLTAGTTRTVPYSALQAGLMARLDGAGESPNVPAAGVNGEAQYAVDLTQSWIDADREDLNEAGINVGRVMFGVIRTYGYRSAVNPLTNAAPWLMLSNVRLNMAIAADGDVIAERYVLAEIDGKRRKIAQFGGELTGMLLGYYNEGSLFGDTPAEAFFVDVGPEVNTLERLAAGELRAVLSLKMSPFAELVTLEIVKVATTEAVA